MKKISFLIGTLSHGGAERVVSNVSLNLSEEFENSIILYGNYDVSYPYRADLNVIDKKYFSSSSNKLFLFFKRRKSMKAIKKQGLCISFLEYPNILNCLTINKNTKTIVSVRNHMSTKHESGIKAKLWNYSIKHLYPRADLVIACSEEIKKDLVLNYSIKPDKIKVIYNSYDIDKIKEMCEEPIEEEFRSIFNQPVIISTGRLSKQKGFEHLIRSFYLARKKQNLKLVILGKGIEEKNLKKLVSSLNLNNDVFFLGFQDNPFKYIYNSKIYAMTSHFEGFPNALSEAMACGLPVISTDCLSGPREILAPLEIEREKFSYEIDVKRYGILTPVFKKDDYFSHKFSEEEEFFSDKILEILSDSNLYEHFCKQSKLRISDFHISKLISQWEDIFK